MNPLDTNKYTSSTKVCLLKGYHPLYLYYKVPLFLKEHRLENHHYSSTNLCIFKPSCTSIIICLSFGCVWMLCSKELLCSYWSSHKFHRKFLAIFPVVGNQNKHKCSLSLCQDVMMIWCWLLSSMTNYMRYFHSNVVVYESPQCSMWI